MSWDSCDWPEFFSERISTARKDYRCCECRHPIRKGTLYWYCSGKWDGEIDYHRQHMECRDACFEFQTRNRECIPFGELREHLSDHGPRWELERNSDDYVLRERDELEIILRDLMAAGIRASRLKHHQIEAYNARHISRKKYVI